MVGSSFLPDPFDNDWLFVQSDTFCAGSAGWKLLKRISWSLLGPHVVVQLLERRPFFGGQGLAAELNGHLRRLA